MDTNLAISFTMATALTTVLAASTTKEYTPVSDSTLSTFQTTTINEGTQMTISSTASSTE
ncbi:hypothetical protein LSH36_435g04004, partial [Paralvinella palmiformis]